MPFALSGHLRANLLAHSQEKVKATTKNRTFIPRSGSEGMENGFLALSEKFISGHAKMQNNHYDWWKRWMLLKQD